MYKILIVDDDIEILEILYNELVKYGFVVFKASSGKDAIEVLKKNTDINIVISDFRMPNGDGRFVLDYVHSMENKPVFYFFSAQADINSEEAKTKNVQKIYIKPSNLNLLLTELKDLYGPYDK
jgi:CheY-like chemotaxis protein